MKEIADGNIAASFNSSRTLRKKRTKVDKLPFAPAPFFHYQDHSRDVDDDPLIPLTRLGHVPNFPAKLHAILGNPKYQDIVMWMPHGRAWKIIEPREFEIQIVPTYFGTSKISSFTRQANGWGFRRITKGKDQNCYYNELFLRGLPHLCKRMKRPKVNQKLSVSPEHEPDLYKISNLFPVFADNNANSADEMALLECAIEGNGPNARIPIFASANPVPKPSDVAIPTAATSMNFAGNNASANQTPEATHKETELEKELIARSPASQQDEVELFSESEDSSFRNWIEISSQAGSNPRPAIQPIFTQSTAYSRNAVISGTQQDALILKLLQQKKEQEAKQLLVNKIACHLRQKQQQQSLAYKENLLEKAVEEYVQAQHEELLHVLQLQQSPQGTNGFSATIPSFCMNLTAEYSPAFLRNTISSTAMENHQHLLAAAAVSASAVKQQNDLLSQIISAQQSSPSQPVMAANNGAYFAGNVHIEDNSLLNNLNILKTATQVHPPSFNQPLHPLFFHKLSQIEDM